LAKRTHYPTYDVLSQQEHWDEHTRAIVLSRTSREREYQILELTEAETLRALCVVLIDDERAEIIQYVLCHMDESLASATGEGERKVGVPKAEQLLREGMQVLERACQTFYLQPFYKLDIAEQRRMVKDLSEGNLRVLVEDMAFPQKALFNKLLNLTLDAYCSHPTVWSEMGYGGPAYPRGYVRTEGEELDPWEAKKDP
jgi:hypothetical protein